LGKSPVVSRPSNTLIRFAFPWDHPRAIWYIQTPVNFLIAAGAAARYSSDVMLYALAIFFPSLAMLLCGKVGQAILCFFLHITVIGWPLATLWAWLVIHDHKEEERTQRLINAG
jgi:hypothetical protein